MSVPRFPPEQRVSPESAVVTRRIDLPPSLVGGTLDVLESGILRIDGGFSPVDAWPLPMWRTAARVQVGTRVAGGTRVAIEISAWSHRACELRIVPVARNVGRWGTRRQRRFFTLVHDGADEVVRLIAEAAQDVEARRLTAPPATRVAVQHALAS